MKVQQTGHKCHAAITWKAINFFSYSPL